MKVQILREALQDLVWGCRFYDAQEEGLGDRLLDSVFRPQQGAVCGLGQ